MKLVLTSLIWVIGLISFGQTGSFAPQFDVAGTNAMHQDSSAFRFWASGCTVERGLRQINLPDSGNATSGNANYAIGFPDAPLTVSLGDGGRATLSFSGNIYDGPGYDFAVFENGFGSGENAFLELAFVEVSSDGQNFIRFLAKSEQQTENQLAGFSESDASLFNNLAGKYVAGYGVPFDISEIPDTNILDKSAISHVRVIDVIGSIDPLYGSIDKDSNLINDPWPTNFPQSGFDLDAVGVINSTIPLSTSQLAGLKPKVQSCYSISGQLTDCKNIGVKMVIYETGETRMIFNALEIN